MTERAVRPCGCKGTWWALWWSWAGKGVLWKRILLRAETRFHIVLLCYCLSQRDTITQLHPRHCSSSSFSVQSSRCPGKKTIYLRAREWAHHLQRIPVDSSCPCQVDIMTAGHPSSRGSDYLYWSSVTCSHTHKHKHRETCIRRIKH